MEYSVKGITFTKDELELVKLSDIDANSVSPCHIFTFIQERPFLLLRAGDFVEEEFLVKYKRKGIQSFYCLNIASEKESQKYKTIFSKFNNAKNEIQRRRVKDELVKIFADDYWKQSDKSFLSFVSACFDQFYNLPEDVVVSLQESSLVLYSRALLTSSFSVMNCVMHSILDTNFISDLYNASFMMDYSLGGRKEFNFLLSIACEKERNAPGSGIEFLKARNDASKELLEFTEHPNLSAELALEHSNCFYNPETVDFIRYHHEKADGSGFPGGHTYGAISETETILMFGDNITPFEEHIFQNYDGALLVKEGLSKLKKLTIQNKLPLNTTLSLWEEAMKWGVAVEERKQGEVA
tara:strand:+ start:202022 stop:203080 length:1059 start_codon:yes stop_codon:yes gene_type:complete